MVFASIAPIIGGLFVLLILAPLLLCILHFFAYLITGRLNGNKRVYGFVQAFTVYIYPIIFLLIMDKENDCCSDSAPFSPDHSATVIALIILCMLAYGISITRFEDQRYSPLMHIIVNGLLLLGIVINIVLCFHLGELCWVFNMAIIMAFIIELVENHKHFVYDIQLDESKPESFQNQLIKILKLPILFKIPILIIFTIPVLVVVGCILVLLGQKPDSAIQAFTQTYHHGFSELDYECAGVVCGDDYLCTIGAHGASDIVRPVRMGFRGGKPIVCSRQLLVCNAFEEIMMERIPGIHKLLRRCYDQLGNFIIRHHTFFNQKWVTTCTYIALKPMEWFFLAGLYLIDHKPENRIARQYMRSDHLEQLKLNTSSL
ncbi:MAG: hypothetical protein JJ975_17390 [Bacteroidia bacterium]|nr:hypothetical protein [Bacteroidia bacterium]